MHPPSSCSATPDWTRATSNQIPVFLRAGKELQGTVPSKGFDYEVVLVFADRACHFDKRFTHQEIYRDIEITGAAGHD